MSQAKVDRYKEEKKNRAKIMAKEKRERMLTKALGIVLGLAVVAWAGFSAYETITAPDSTETTAETESYVINTDALTAYLDGLSAD